MGAAIGNAVSDGVAALPQGYKAAAGVTLGCLLPVVPLGIAMAMGKEIKGTTRNVLLASSAGLLGYAFLSKKMKAADGEIVILGCSKCRGQPTGCVQCKNPAFCGKRFRH